MKRRKKDKIDKEIGELYRKYLWGQVYTLDRGRDLGMILSMRKEVSGIRDLQQGSVRIGR